MSGSTFRRPPAGVRVFPRKPLRPATKSIAAQWVSRRCVRVLPGLSSPSTMKALPLLITCSFGVAIYEGVSKLLRVDLLPYPRNCALPVADRESYTLLSAIERRSRLIALVVVLLILY